MNNVNKAVAGIQQTNNPSTLNVSFGYRSALQDELKNYSSAFSNAAASRKSPSVKTLWHYTTVVNLCQILKSNVLECRRAASTEAAPLLWFSADQQWEPTSAKAIVDSRGRTRLLSFLEQGGVLGNVRFGIGSNDCRIVSWHEACAKMGYSRDQRRSMEMVGHKWGASKKNWFATAVNMNPAHLEFQVWLGEWVSGLSMSEVVDQWNAEFCMP